MKSTIKFVIGVIISGLTLYNSVYILPLDEKLENEIETTFDSKSYVDHRWPEILSTYDTAISISILLELLDENPKQTFDDMSNALGIGNIRYFKISGKGQVISINDNNIIVETDGKEIEIETEFIFGNAIRDASGLVKINSFDRTSDLNSISEAINLKIRNEIIPPFRKIIKFGDSVSFTGAVELNMAHLNLQLPEVIPVSLQKNH